MSMIGRFMPSTRSIWYSCEEDASEARYELRTIHSLREQGDTIAEEAAEDYHHQHDGARDSWPRTFVLYESEGGEEDSRWHVVRDFTPSFLAVEDPRKQAVSKASDGTERGSQLVAPGVESTELPDFSGPESRKDER